VHLLENHDDGEQAYAKDGEGDDAALADVLPQGAFCFHQLESFAAGGVGDHGRHFSQDQTLGILGPPKGKGVNDGQAGPVPGPDRTGLFPILPNEEGFGPTKMKLPSVTCLSLRPGRVPGLCSRPGSP